MESRSATSIAIAVALPPPARTASTTSADFSASRAAMATVAPAPASAWVNASPRPRLPPVTTATRPVRSNADRTPMCSPPPSIPMLASVARGGRRRRLRLRGAHLVHRREAALEAAARRTQVDLPHPHALLPRQAHGLVEVRLEPAAPLAQRACVVGCE